MEHQHWGPRSGQILQKQDLGRQHHTALQEEPQGTFADCLDWFDPSVPVQDVSVRGRPPHLAIPLLEEAALEPRQTQSVQQDLRPAVRVRDGGHGRAATQHANDHSQHGSGGFRGDHHFAGGRTHVSLDDKHLYFAQYRGDLQFGRYRARARVAPREAALVH